MSNHPPSYPPPGPQGGYGAPQYGQPPYAPPQYGPPPAPAPQKKGGKGCLIALFVLLALGVGSVLAIGYGINWVGDKAEQAIGTTTPCPYITSAEATEAVGTDAEATLFTGGLGRILNITDLRVLPDKESCIIQQTSSSSDQQAMPGLGRAVKYEGADARALYEQELVKAKGTKEDRGNGITVESEKYFNKSVSGLGDEAFCTKSSGILAGVLVVDGDTLVYVAVTRADVAPGVDLDDPSNAKLSTDDPACESSQALARKILAKG
jgi:hypothetical protein